MGERHAHPQPQARAGIGPGWLEPVTTDPLTCLHEALDAVANGHPLPPAAAAWLRSGLSRYIRQGEPLEAALRLGVASRTIARNRALIEAAQCLDPDAAPWDQAETLRLAILRFETRVLPRLRAGADRDLSPHEECLLRAFGAGAPRMLRSRRRLWDLLTSS